MKKIFRKYNNQKGLSFLVIIVVLGIATLVLAFGASMIGLGELELGYTSDKSSQNFAWADGCVDEALHRLRLDNNYTGGSLSLGDTSCIIGVVAASSDRIVTVTSTLDIYTKVLEVDLTITSGKILINSFEEI